MSQVLLINPAKRRKNPGAKRKSRRTYSAAQRANMARFAAASRARSGKRRSKHKGNPIAFAVRRRTYKRRGNPIIARRRRRSNPIGRSMGGGLLNFRSYIAPIKDAAVMGLGAVGMDIAFNYVNRYLPASLQAAPGQVNTGTAVKAILTVALGKLLSGPTRGLSQKAAMGSLVVQMRDVSMALLPASVTTMGVGFYNAGRVVPGTGVRASGNTRLVAMGQGGVSGGVGEYVTGQSPLLGRVGEYVGGQSPLLSRAPSFRR